LLNQYNKNKGSFIGFFSGKWFYKSHRGIVMYACVKKYLQNFKFCIYWVFLYGETFNKILKLCTIFEKIILIDKKLNKNEKSNINFISVRIY